MDLNERISRLVKIKNAETLKNEFHTFFNSKDVSVEVCDGEPMVAVHDIYFTIIEAQDALSTMNLLFFNMEDHTVEEEDEDGIFWKQGLILDQLISEGNNNERTKSGNGVRAS